MRPFTRGTSLEVNAAQRFAEHALSLSADTVPQAAVAAAKAFLLDTLGVGIAGARANYSGEVLSVAEAWGPAPQAAAMVLGRRVALPAHAAAFVNAFQIHCQEFDCVHEAAVVHPLATIVAALMADTARLQPVDGRTVLAAIIAGVDVAAGLGLAAQSALKFFRPATAGIFGSVAALARIRRLDVDTTVSAFGHALAFVSGTMQAHVEGKPGLALQIGNAARNALVAVDLAVAGVPGVSRSIDGPFGYFSLLEDDADLTEVLAELGKRYRIVEVSHKPFPTGRAAHGALFATQTLMAEHGVSAGNLESLSYRAPPLIYRLVGRRINASLSPNYARLCFAYLGAVVLLRGTLGLADFSAESLADPEVHALAARIEVIPDDNPDPAAFTPAVATARLRDGSVATVRVSNQPGSPESPLTWPQQLAKFRACVEFGSGGRAGKAAFELPQLILAMESESSVTNLWSKACF